MLSHIGPLVFAVSAIPCLFTYQTDILKWNSEKIEFCIFPWPNFIFIKVQYAFLNVQFVIEFQIKCLWANFSLHLVGMQNPLTPSTREDKLQKWNVFKLEK